MTTDTFPQLKEIMTMAQEDLRGARKAMRRVVPSLPDAAPVHTALGLTYIALEQPRDAMRSFKRAIELDPSDPLPRYHLGAQQSDAGLLPQAEENLRQAVAAEPENLEYQAALGFTYYKADKREEAMSALEKAVDLGSEDDDVFASLGYLYYYADRLDESLAAFSQAIHFNPEYAEVYNNRGYLNLLLGNLDDAENDLATCLSKDAEFLRAAYNQALTTWLQGKHEQAMQQYNAARRRDTNDAELRQHLEDFSQVSALHPEDDTLQDLKVKLAVAQKASRR